MSRQPTIIFLSDQKEYLFYDKLAQNLSQDFRLVLINTRPLPKTEDIRRKASLVFDCIYGWEDVLQLKSSDVFDDVLYQDEFIQRVLDNVSWPQTVESVLSSDQYAHVRYSGRFYQNAYGRNYLKNSFGVAYELCRKVIDDNPPSLVYSYGVRDVNKIGALCAFLANDIEVVELSPTNVSALKLAKKISRRNKEIINSYYGVSLGEAKKVFSCEERAPEKETDKLILTWGLAEFSKNHSLIHKEENCGFQDTRKQHHFKHGINNRLVLKNLKVLLRSIVEATVLFPKNVIKSLLVSDCNIPYHEKNRAHRIKKITRKQVWGLLRRLKATRNSIFSLISTHDNIPHKYIVALHYFPESTTISGLAWRGVKHEADLLAQPDLKKILDNENTCLIEHPVYLKNGERAGYFWSKIKEQGYSSILKYSKGIDVSALNDKILFTISGSVALEMAASGGRSYIAKNSPLLLVERVGHIVEFVSDDKWEIVYPDGKISPEQYISVIKEVGITNVSEEGQLLTSLVNMMER